MAVHFSRTLPSRRRECVLYYLIHIVRVRWAWESWRKYFQVLFGIYLFLYKVFHSLRAEQLLAVAVVGRVFLGKRVFHKVDFQIL